MTNNLNQIDDGYNMENLQIMTNRKAIKTLNTTDKNIMTYMDNLVKLLGIYGFKDLRENQKDAIFHLFNSQDLLFVTETSGGKSFCYIAPALCMGLKTIVFFPLVSLIQDQAYQLRLKGCKVGEVSSNVSMKESKQALIDWENGLLDFLFIAPERLVNEQFMELMSRVPPDFVVVDEIHSASEYGDNFRSSYKLIAPFIEKVCPKLFLGQTATMSAEVEEDVREIFKMPETTKLVKSYLRPNLKYKIAPSTYDGDYTSYIYEEVTNTDVPVIVYCSTIKKVRELYAVMKNNVKGGVMMYYGEMSPNEKENNQQNFITGQVRVAIATNAFGMGINKSDIGKVIFATIPSSLEELTQCFGRGGRNGCECMCVLCPDEKSLRVQKMFIDFGFPPQYIFNNVYKALESFKNKDTNIVNATIQELADYTGNSRGTMSVSSVIEFLKGDGIIQRIAKDNTTKIRFLDLPSTSVTTDKVVERFNKYRDMIELLSLENEETSTLDLDINLLSNEISVSVTTIKSNLENFSKLGYLSYTKPTNSQPIKILKPLNSFNYNKVIEKRNKKLANFNKVIKYMKLTSTSQLSSYLQEHYLEVNS